MACGLASSAHRFKGATWLGLLKEGLMSVSALLALLGSSTVGAPALPFDLPDRTMIARFHAEGAQVYDARP